MPNQRGTPLTLTNGAAALTRNRFVKLVSGVLVVAAAGTDEDVVGVTTDDVAIGDEAAITMIDGMTVYEVEAGAAIALGAQVASGADGKAATAGASDIPVGIALSASSADGEYIDVLLVRLGAAT